MKKAATLRELFSRQSIIRIAGAHHALGAKLVERAGFDGVWASGLEISTAHAVPDASILTMTEYALLTRKVSPFEGQCGTRAELRDTP